MHTALLGLAAWLVTRAASSSPAVEPVVLVEPAAIEQEIELDLPPMVEVTSLLTPAPPRPDDPSIEVQPSGGERADARPDQERDGRGGMPEVTQAALNMADHDDGLLLAKDAQSRLDRSQVQRLRVGEQRSSLDDRRATWQPMELTFIASGRGKLMERRALADRDPSRGAHAASLPGVLGGAPGAAPLPSGEGESPRDPGNARRGGERASPGQGVVSGAEGVDHRESAASAFARPQITEARPAVPAPRADKPRDNRDTDQEVASVVQSLLHASTAGGKQGAGTGGDKGGDRPGAGGPAGAGSRAKALGPGGGGPVDADSSDPQMSLYVRGVRAKVSPLWANAFPRWAALEGRGGRAIIALVIQPDGRLSSTGIARPSGIGEFDENVRRAVLRAAPFPPLPPNLRGRPLRIYITFDALNAPVR
jgi:TonB family protein